MKAVLPFVSLLALASMPATAIEPMMDRMPVVGDRTHQLERRIENLERQLREKEAGNQTAEKQSATKPSAWLQAETTRAQHLMKNAKYAESVDVHREILATAAKAITINPETLADCFFASYGAAMAAEQLEVQKELKLAQALLEATVKTLRQLQVAAPAWNPAIVKYRLDRTEATLARLQ